MGFDGVGGPQVQAPVAPIRPAEAPAVVQPVPQGPVETPQEASGAAATTSTRQADPLLARQHATGTGDEFGDLSAPQATAPAPEPSTPAAFGQRAASRLAAGDEAGAIKDLERGIALAKQKPGGKKETAQLLTALGEIYFQQAFVAGEYVRPDCLHHGANLCKEALALDPQNREAQQRVNTANVLEGHNIGAARYWKPGSTDTSGVEANGRINATYNQLDGQFTKYLGDPPISNWMTFGKYASREAGTQIRNLETSLNALNTFTTLTADVTRYKDAAQSVVNLMLQDKMFEQSVRMAAEMAGVKLQAGLTVQNVAAALAAAGPSLVIKMVGALDNLHRAMVEGNTRIFENIGPAYHAFLRAEAAGGNGVDALKAAGYGSPPKPPDEQGFVMEAFTRYKKAQELGAQAARPDTPPEERTRLLAERKQIMGEANLYIGLQEQMVILQKATIFGDPQVAQLLGAMSGTMDLKTAGGPFTLLHSGGNWADFATRMGLQEVPAGTKGAIPVRHPDGTTHQYIPHPDPKQQAGTIIQLFTNFLDGTASKIIREGAPRLLDSDD